MSNQKFLPMMISLALITLFSGACSAPTATQAVPTPEREATATRVPVIATSVPTDTPVPPSPTPVPPTSAPAVLGIGDTASLNTWEFKVTGLSYQELISGVGLGGWWSAQEGFTFLTIDLRLKSSSEMTSTLQIDLNEVGVSDAEGRVYSSGGMGTTGGFIAYGPMIGGSITSKTRPRNGQTIVLEVSVSETAKSATLTASGNSEFDWSIAFQVPQGASGFRLTWPGLPLIDLSEMPAPSVTPTPVPPTPTPTSSSEATISVKLEKPVVLMDDKIKLTVTDVRKRGKDLRLTVLVENLANETVVFASRALNGLQDVRTIILKFDGGEEREITRLRMGGFKSPGVVLLPERTVDGDATFTVPSELERFTLRLKIIE